MPGRKIVITGAAGLVGQNLIPRLKTRRLGELVAIDKHLANVATLRRLHPELRVIEADLAEAGEWEREFEGCTQLVNAHAQIGGLYSAEYVRNNVTATERVLAAARRNGVSYVVNISSSVVNSKAVDDYTETKKAQEAMVAQSGIKQVVLRPTLMFGWFDRKHVGWLARFMQRVPVFPVPGNGRFLRQPLFAGDFCDVIASSLERETTGAYNITGQERIDYIELIRAVKRATGAKAKIVRIPYRVFWVLLKINALWDKNPAFTARQLEALVTPDVFEVIDWPGIFGVRATPLEEALEVTFRDPTYSGVVLEF
ncbi:MAG TPA: NAD(P)-dependent oxidoreductase [Acidobacteriaceae bacterium]|jgi:nucleoside-diphosphate-sugar epimerase|nr:NAD(P)-dependent oxidoreductase [Acidobacteriaceae bacterium]